MNPNENNQFVGEQNRRFASVGVLVGLVIGGLLGLVVGILIDNSPFMMIMGAGGGMVIGLALGTAWDRRIEER